MKNSSIAYKMILQILSCALLILILIMWYNYYSSRQTMLRELKSNAGNLTSSIVNRIETVLQAVQKVPLNAAYELNNFEFTKEELIVLVKGMVANNPEIYGATIAFEPYGFDPKQLYFSPYCCMKDDTLSFTYIGCEDYEYFYSDWYQIPKILGRPIWSEPYFDVGAGNIVMSTYSVPFYRTVNGERKFAGIVTADISLRWLQELIASMKIYKTGYGVVITKNATIVSHPDDTLIMNHSVFSLAEQIGDTNLHNVGKAMIKGETVFVPYKSIYTGKKYWQYIMPIPSNGWSVAVLFPEKELLADVRKLTKKLLIIGFVGIILLFLMVNFISRSIAKPLTSLAKAAQKIAKGDLNAKLPPIKSSDEIGQLTDSFVYLENELKKYIINLKETTAVKERIESELKIAHDIQMGILPKIFPPFPDRPEFDIFAIIEPAKEVGGDLYDFFFVDDNNICFTIGDVSGKGIPASLFMAVTKTLIKATTSMGMTPDQVLYKVNNELCQENENMMFSTLFYGILNLITGEVLYANAGHNIPYYISRDGELRFLEKTQGMALGVIENVKFETNKITLRKNDSLFLYTDGVNEAMDINYNEFSMERLTKTLKPLYNESPVEIINKVIEEINIFAAGVDQSDDITILVLKYFEGSRD